jgi:lycopene cyclase domain-containing protein
MQSNDVCHLHYTSFHLLFTIPQLVILYIIAAPFLTALDWYKLYLLPVIAFVWTTPWDNELVRKEAWSYPPSCVLARIGYVPVEEYFFVSYLLQRDETMCVLILASLVHHPIANDYPSHHSCHSLEHAAIKQATLRSIPSTSLIYLAGSTRT